MLLVIIESVPRGLCNMGTVDQTIAGKDGAVREALVGKGSSSRRRDVQKLPIRRNKCKLTCRLERRHSTLEFLQVDSLRELEEICTTVNLSGHDFEALRRLHPSQLNVFNASVDTGEHLMTSPLSENAARLTSPYYNLVWVILDRTRREEAGPL
ncbi:hypothetical protein EG68_10878 [Paragonimus skrjabini miyazakii]|uniref:Uncharacterized protein n=1 Tax=Paragonimus skrjabini miyazakii TaxID=59628 RepID=A0A8S9YIY5_9TREM|nr:hypothetical protein EG68_10878 [Paragonimus skrjabini miyazakii]